MKKILCTLAALAFCAGAAFAAISDGSADTVFGQSSLAGISENNLDGGGLHEPYDVVVDTTHDRAFAADKLNNRVLWWNGIARLASGAPADGVLGQEDFVSAGSNRGHFASFTTAAFLAAPVDLALDADGNLWVADSENNRVLRFRAPFTSGMSADKVLGQASFDATGTGTGRSRMTRPSAVAVDRWGALWVADSGNHRVLRFSPSFDSGMQAAGVLGQGNFDACSPNRGLAPSALTLSYPCGLSFDSGGNLWVADRGNNRVLRYASGDLGTNGVAASILLGQPQWIESAVNNGGVAVGMCFPSAVYAAPGGRLYVADRENNRVLFWNNALTVPSGRNPEGVLGQGNFTFRSPNRSLQPTEGGLYYPQGMCLDAQGNLWVADSGNCRLLRYPAQVASTGAANAVAGQPAFTVDGPNGVTAAGLFSPDGLCVDHSRDRLYVADTANNRVLWWNGLYRGGISRPADGVIGQPDFLHARANRGSSVTADSLAQPGAVTVDPAGNLWVCDDGNNRVLRYPAPVGANTAADLVLGQTDMTGHYPNRSGAVAANTLDSPSGMAFDREGCLWVADRNSNRVLRYRPPFALGMAAEFVIGQANMTSGQLNQGRALQDNGTLATPRGIAIDASGALWVADVGNNRVLRFSPPFVPGKGADLVIGQADFLQGNDNRGGSMAADTLNGPTWVSLSPSGKTLWVSDGGNNRLLGYSAPFDNGMRASLVIGQNDFSNNDFSTVGPRLLYNPYATQVDARGNLWVADRDTHRVLLFGASAQTANPAGASGGVLVYPNPWRPGSRTAFGGSAAGKGVVFSGLAPQASVKLYTLGGELVREIRANDSGTALWDARNNGGDNVASGVYLYVVDGGGRGKVAILR